MKRIVVVSVLLAGVAISALARAHDEHEGKCTIAKRDSPLAKACAHGGRKAAAKEMKRLVKKAKAAGVKMKCDHCHKDMDSLELKPRARDELKKLLAAAAAS